MLTISQDDCLNATIDGFFCLDKFDSTHPLTYDDIIFLAEYIREHPITRLDFSLGVTEENVHGLNALSKAIEKKTNLVELNFRIKDSDFHLTPNDTLFHSIINYFDNRRIKKLNHLIYDATERMIRKKPILEKLHLDLKAVESPAEKSQANKIARSIKKLDLTHLAINFSVKKDSELPILDRRHTNDKLVELKIHGLSQGRSIFKHIQNTSALRVLDIEDMHFERSDFQLIEALLKANPDLNTIRFNTTNIGQIDSPLLINSLRLLPHLAYLDLSDCNLGRTTIMPLCDLISRNPDHLIELNLANNAFVSSDAIKLADSFLFNNKIEKLNLDGNYIENDGMLEFLEIIKIGRHITTLLMSNNCRYTLSDDTLGSLCLILADPDCALEELGFEQHNSIKQLEQLKDAIVSNSSLIKVTLNYKTNVIWGALYKKIIQDHINGLTPLVNNRAHIIKTWGSAASLPKEETPPVSIGKAKEAFFATDDDTEDDGYGYHPLWQLGKKIGSQPIVPVTVQSGMSKS